MAAERVVHVVEVERVRGNAVDERGVEHVGAFARAEHETRPAVAGELARDPRAIFAAAGERHADCVEDADLGPMHRVGGKVFEAQRGGAAREVTGELHQWGSFAAAPALLPASRPNTAPDTRPVPLG